jgi:hypothetical protein
MLYGFDDLTASLSHSRKNGWRYLQPELRVLLFLGKRAASIRTAAFG